MKHRVRTAYGDSTDSITPEEIFGGSGQGSGASPTACHTQLISMVSTLESITPGYLISNPTGTLSILQHVISWVDDTVNKEFLHRNNSTQDNLQRIHDILVHWRRILRVTGGDLELSKTVIYLIDYMFLDGGTWAHYKSKEQTQGVVTSNNGSRT